MKIANLILSVTLLISLGCSGDEVEPSVLTLLTNNGTKSWRVVEMKINGELDQTDCQRDDIYTFTLFDESTEQTFFRIEENLISCEFEYEYEKASGSWRINNKGNRLTLLIRDEYEDFDDSEEINTDFYNLTLDIVEISDSKLVLRQFDEWNEFAPEIYTITLNEF